MPYLSKKAYFSLLIFCIGLVLTIIIIQADSVSLLIEKLGNTSPLGALIGGILYAFSFTSSLATAIFLNISHQLNPLAIALAGGLGAAIYDLTIFTIVRQQLTDGFLHTIRETFDRHQKMPRWLSLIIGVIILGSPLPDEVAAGFLGFMRLSAVQFIIISFLANAVGIYCITMLR